MTKEKKLVKKPEVTKSKKQIILSILIILSLFSLQVNGEIQLSFTDDSVPNNTYTQNNHTGTINVSIETSILDTFKFNWNGTNYTIYNDSLVLGMNFDNNSALGENSTHAYDFSSSGNNGTFKGAGEPAWTTSGKYNGALSFDGTDGYVDCGNDTSLRPATDWTIEYWAKVAALSPAEYKGALCYQIDTSNRFYIRHPSLGGSSVLVWSNVDGTTQLSTGQATDTNWHHWVFTFEGTTWKTYKDGDLKVTDTGKNDFGNLVGADNHLYLGVANSALGGAFNGAIDEVRIYNRALGQSEIKKHYELLRLGKQRQPLLVH